MAARRATRDDSGDLVDDDEDDRKILGIFSSREMAEARINRAGTQPGFELEPDCFLIDEYPLDEDQWTEGFITLPIG